MVTLKDIAAEADVSIATVSYCINGSRHVSAKTRNRVMQVIEEMHYVPNVAARNLKRSRNMEIGVILPDLDDDYRAKVLKGIIDSAEERGYSISVAFTYNSPKQERKVINDFVGRNVRGLIVDTCQQDNTRFFLENVLSRSMSTVFIENGPDYLDINEVTFNNFKSHYLMTKELLTKGYKKIGVVTGTQTVGSVRDSIDGYKKAFEDAGVSLDESLIVYTDGSKEGAFRETMRKLLASSSQAIVVSSELLLKGVSEALGVYGLRLGEDVCVLAGGEERWNSSDYLDGVIYCLFAAYKMGEQCIGILDSDIKEKGRTSERLKIEENFYSLTREVPPCKGTVPKNPAFKRKKVLRILSPAQALKTMDALSLLSANFTLRTGIGIEIEECEKLSDLYDRIVDEKNRRETSFDIFVYDIPWMMYLRSEGALRDITSFFERRDDIKERFVKKNLENCRIDGKFYGIPVIGGTHHLFYRKDLFETPEIRRAYGREHSLPLRPPVTWREFNNIARFFTREFNRDSATIAGTAVDGSITANMMLEILIRLWGYGGGLADEKGELKLNTPENIEGMRSLLETLSYTKEKGVSLSREDVFRNFDSGSIAMIVSFTEYASKINDEASGEIISKIGYSMMPGGKPANVGWNFGISPRCDKSDELISFFEWFSKKQISYYMTILCGQTAVRYPHQNHEIEMIYPWISLSERGQRLSKSRRYPYIGKAGPVKPSEIEDIMADAFFKMQQRPDMIGELLSDAQKKMKKVLR